MTAYLPASCGKVGVPNLVVYMNKIDLLDDRDSMIELVKEEVSDLLKLYGYDPSKVPFVAGSALCAVEGRDPEIGRNSIIKLLDEMDKNVPIPPREYEKPFLMAIEDVFSIQGRGTVLSGCIERGTVKMNSEVDILGHNKQFKTTVTGLESFRRQLDQGQAGDNLGILVRGIKREDMRRGMIICQPGTLKMAKKVEAELYVLKTEEGGRHTSFTNKYRPQMFIRTADVTVVVSLPEDRPMAMPGDNLKVTLDLHSNMPLEVGQRFTMRESNKTVGTGVVTKVIE
jgi:elongation factor Tu